MPIRGFLCLALFGVIPGVAVSGQFTTAINGPSSVTVSAIAIDSVSNTYIVGNTQLPGTPSFVNSPVSTQAHVIVTKLDPDGNVLFTDTFAGQGVDTGTAITVDSSGNIYVAGATTSPDFPTAHALQTQIFLGGTLNGVPVGTGFITKISNDGGTILYSTFFGGTLGQSAISSLAVDANGNLYLTGYTQATDFPHTAGMPFGAIGQSPASPGAIIASISAAGDKILYSGAIPMVPPCNQLGSTCIGHTIEWEGVGIAVDPAGNAYIAGNAGNASLPTTPGVLSPNGLGAFVAKINAGGAGIGYLTFLGSGQVGQTPFNTPLNTVYAIAVDAAGNAYLGGETADTHFPATPGSFRSAFPETGITGFLAKLNPTGSALVWATFFDVPQSIALDAVGNVWANGSPNPPSLPNQYGWSTGTDYLAALNAAGSELVYSALYPTGTVGQSMALDPSSLVHAAGRNGFVSAIAPFTLPSPKIFFFGNAAGSSATARLSPGEVISIYGPGIGPTSPATAMPSDGLYPTALAGVEASVNDIKMPLLYVGANQINAVVPMELMRNAPATVHLTDGTVVSSYPVWILPSAPLAFGPVINQNGTLNSAEHPAKSSSVVTFYATGWQSTFFPLADGQVATMAQDVCQGNCLAVGVITAPPFGSQLLSATALYGGDAPGLVAGITQFNVQIGAVPSSSSASSSTVSVQGPASGAGPGPAVSAAVWVTP